MKIRFSVGEHEDGARTEEETLRAVWSASVTVSRVLPVCYHCYAPLSTLYISAIMAAHLTKSTVYNIEDSNISLLGSDVR